MGVDLYHSLKQTDTKNYDFGEGELNSLGYKLGAEKRFAEAIRIFELNTISYPQSSNAFDSLAEGYFISGDKSNAIKYYKQAIALDPTNLNSINMLKKLQP